MTPAQLQALLKAGKVKTREKIESPPTQNAWADALKDAQPHAQLVSAVRARWPHAVEEHPCIPGRRFRLDIALVPERIAIEFDGWEYHGKHHRDFLRDREKRNLLAAAGWLLLAFTNRDIRKRLPHCLELIEHAIKEHTSSG